MLVNTGPAQQNACILKHDHYNPVMKVNDDCSQFYMKNYDETRWIGFSVIELTNIVHSQYLWCQLMRFVY